MKLREALRAAGAHPDHYTTITLDRDAIQEINRLIGTVAELERLKNAGRANLDLHFRAVFVALDRIGRHDL